MDHSGWWSGTTLSHHHQQPPQNHAPPYSPQSFLPNLIYLNTPPPPYHHYLHYPFSSSASSFSHPYPYPSPVPAPPPKPSPPSSSSLRPPGVDPVVTAPPTTYARPPAHGSGYEGHSSLAYSYPQPPGPAAEYLYYPRGGGVDAQGFTVKEAIRQYGTDPYAYAGAAIARYPSGLEQSVSTTFAPVQNNFQQHPHSNRVLKKKRVKMIAKVVQSAYCEVCKIDCNSQEVLNSHKFGKKHKKNLEKLKASIMPNPSRTAEPVLQTAVDSNSKGAKRKVARATEADTRTKKQMILESGKAATQPTLQMTEITAATQAVSQTTQITAAAQPILHTRQSTVATQSILQTSKTIATSQPILQTTEIMAAAKPILQTAKSTAPAQPLLQTAESNKVNHARKNIAPAEKKDLETKKRKVLECGAAVEDVKICTICNVVCNRDVVLSYHLAGKKHLAMVRKLQASLGN